MVYESYKSKEKKSNKSFIHFLIGILIIGQAFDAGYYLYAHLFPIKHLLRLDLLFFVLKHGIFTLIIIYIYRHSQLTLGEFTRRKVFFLIFSFFTVIAWFNGSILGFLYWDGPYRGRVVDADTNEPIAGANVMVSWDFNLYLFIVEQDIFADARETVTDVNGNFILPTAKATVLWPFSSMHFEQLHVYKTGYDSHPPRMPYAWDEKDYEQWHDKLVQIYPKYKEENDPKVNYVMTFYVLPKDIKTNKATLIRLNKSTSLDEQWEAAAIPTVGHYTYERDSVKNIYNMRDEEMTRIRREKYQKIKSKLPTMQIINKSSGTIIYESTQSPGSITFDRNKEGHGSMPEGGHP